MKQREETAIINGQIFEKVPQDLKPSRLNIKASFPEMGLPS